MISFYTPNWKYPEYAHALTEDCKRLGVNYLIESRQDTGDYLANCRLKPAYIAECLRRLDGPVLWIDVDGSLYWQPTLLEGDIGYDFGARRKPPTSPRTWHVCTLYFTPNALPFVDEWTKACEKQKWSDESALNAMWDEGIQIPAFELPASYHHIWDHGDVPAELVIGHRLSDSEQKNQFMRQRAIRA